MINIYAPNHYREKVCWNSLKDILSQVQNRSIIIGGDLNRVFNADEKFGGSFHVDPSRYSIENIMESYNLLDIPPNNGIYTWSNKTISKSNIKESPCVIPLIK